MREYSIYGPFKIKKQRRRVDRSKEAREKLWAEVEKRRASLSEACGCYLFAIKAAKGFRPWYVGLAEKQSFKKECLSLHKREIYNEVLADRKGTPILFLLAKQTNGGRFAKPSKSKSQAIRFLESLLIGMTIKKNSKLMNIHKTKLLRELRVPTLVNAPRRRPTKEESEFTKVIK